MTQANLSVVEVIAMHSAVLIDGEIPATIIAIELRDTNVSYQCSWWNERDRKTDWFSAREIKPANSEQRTARIVPALQK